MRIYFSILFAFAVYCGASCQNKLYVDQSMPADGDGLSWSTAIKEVSTALDTVWQNPNIDTVFVAEGLYKPTTKPYTMNASQTGSPISTPNQRDITFHMRPGLTVIGGFSSSGSSYDPALYETIFSGDIGTPSFKFDNTFHVVISNKTSFWTTTDPEVNLSGLNIRHGHSTGGGSVTINGNSLPRTDGGGIFHVNGTLNISQMAIDSNLADYHGGGLYKARGESMITQSRFWVNSADIGGAACYLNDGSANVHDCTFENNNRDLKSFTIFVTKGEKLDMSHTDFTNNFHSAISADSDTIIVTHSSVTGTQGDFFTSEFEADFLEISNCIFKDNSDPYSFEPIMRIYDQESGNIPGVRFKIDNNEFINNNQAIFCEAGVYITNNIFSNHVDNGPCISSYYYYPDTIYIANNIFHNNAGSAVNIDGGVPLIYNNTFAYNRRGVISSADKTFVSNCIFWKNSINGQTNVRGVDFTKSSSALNAEFSNNRMQLNSSQYYGTNDLGISSNNLFTSPLNFQDEMSLPGSDGINKTADDGFILIAGSNGINQGANSFVQSTADITGSMRIQDGIVDMGAYETYCPAASPRISQAGTNIANQDFTPSTADSTLLVADDIINNPVSVTFLVTNDSLASLILIGDKVTLTNGDIFTISQPPSQDTIAGNATVEFTLSADLTDCQLLDSILYDTVNIMTNSCQVSLFQFAISIEITGSFLPDLITPNDTVVSCEQLNTILTQDAILSGNCDSISITSELDTATINCSDTLLRIWTIEDINGNQASDTQQIILFDSIAPVIFSVNDTTINCSEYNISLTWASPLATDNCDSNLTLSFVDSIINQTCKDLIYRKWTTIDDCGNSAETIRRIEVIDNLPPLFTTALPVNQSYFSPGNSCSMSIPIEVPGLADFCGGQPMTRITSSDPTVYFFYIPGASIWIADFPVGTTLVTITGDDGCGNIIEHIFSIEIKETFPPQFTVCPSNVYGSENCDGLYEWQNPSVIDNCLPDTFSISFEILEAFTASPFVPANIIYTGNNVLGGQTESELFCPGITRVSYFIKDVSGNEDSCYFDMEIPVNSLSTYYVDKSALGNNSGFDWANAYTSLESIFLNECISSIDTIKIAAGIYRPLISDRNFSYSFGGNTVVFGGYTPGGMSYDPANNETIIDGNAGNQGSRSDNLFHVVTIESNATAVQLHSLSITRGNANTAMNQSGGGILAFGKASLYDVHVHGNRSAGPGSGISIQPGGNIQLLSQSIFENNYSTVGVTFETVISGKLLIGDDSRIE